MARLEEGEERIAVLNEHAAAKRTSSGRPMPGCVNTSQTRKGSPPRSIDPHAAETAEGTLGEIYASRGWLWLSRYRAVRHRLVPRRASTTITPRRQAVAVKRPLPDRTLPGLRGPDFATPRGKAEKGHPRHRQFMTGGSSRLVVDLFEHLGHRYDQEVITSFIPTPRPTGGSPFTTSHGWNGRVTWPPLPGTGRPPSSTSTTGANATRGGTVASSKDPGPAGPGRGEREHPRGPDGG